jgi:hypothetical protein
MSADKRSTSTDALETLGTIIDETGRRDAIHLAVEPVVAGETLRPGDDVGFLPDGTAGTNASTLLGIVDPFLKAKVKKGQRFWLVVYPRKITSLRHVWEHPAFHPSLGAQADVVDVVRPRISKRDAVAWFQVFSKRHRIDYYTALQAGRDWVESEEYFTQQDSESLRSAMEDDSTRVEFWENFEVITGLKVAEDRKGIVFSCSC